ncbi:MAG: hypothetical protein ACTSSH_09765 [Candidatus Heimdallarchaeota archaeon]
MRKARVVISLVFISSLILPMMLKSDTTIDSYPSAYPEGGLHSRMIWASLNSMLYLGVNESSYLYQIRQEIVNPVTDYLDELYRAQDDYDGSYAQQWEHYWNPYTKTGLYGNRGAPYHAEDHFELAVDYYLGNGLYPVDKTRAYYYLGYAIHLIQDLTVPYHAQNDPFNKHVTWEAFCDYHEDQGYYDLPLNFSYAPPRDWNGKINTKSFVHNAALTSAPYYNFIEENDYSFLSWLNIAEFLVGHSIKLTASFLLYFWQFVNDIDYDEDGLSGITEFEYGTDYTSNDSDNDTITDLEEITLGVDGFLTNPMSIDSDRDSYPDNDEIFIHFTDPTDAFDSPYYAVPLYCPHFVGLSNTVTSITFSWSRPANFLPTWYYAVFKLNGNSEQMIYSGMNRTFTYHPIDTQEFTSYRLYCYKTEGIRGIYSQWAGSINSYTVKTGIQE